jgi:hypothetical protein
MRICFLLILAMISTTAFAGPQFEMVGQPADVGNGEWEFQYKLTNFGGAVPLYDVEFDYSIAAAWIRVESDNGEWHWDGPLAAWQTDTAPCEVDQELYGFHIYAGGPEYSMSPLTFTDQSHTVCASGDALLPVVPEPGSLIAFGSGLVALAGTFLRKRKGSVNLSV